MCEGTLTTIDSNDEAQWQAVLDEVGDYDFYHLPAYNRQGAEDESGKAVMFVYRESENLIAWPLIVRDIASTDGLEETGKGLSDATSVYGYPGPIGRLSENDEGLRERFARSLEESFNSLGLLSAFSRMNPVLQNQTLLPAGFGELIGLGETVSIDLTLEPDEQLKRMKKNTRYDIRRARRDGLEVHIDEEWKELETFVSLYHQSMERVDAKDYYFFDKPMFVRMKEYLGDRAKLFVGTHEGVVCAASMFIRTGNIIQYHLSGSRTDYAKMNGPKVLIDAARVWGHAEGAKLLHLGGGLSSNEDDLFWQKTRFSPDRHKFHIWKWSSKSPAIDSLVEARKQWLTTNGDPSVVDSGYFPAYRAF